MVSVKVKFRSSIAGGKEGTIYYQVIRKGVICRIKTDYRIFAEEWDENTSRIRMEAVQDSYRRNYLFLLQEHIDCAVKRLESIAAASRVDSIYSAGYVMSGFCESANGQSLCRFMSDVIAQLKRMNRERTAETYTATLKSFMSFRKGNDVMIDKMNPDLMMEYEAWLKSRGVTMNTVSFYMRILRAVYNRAAEKGVARRCNVFRHVYTGIGKTVKRAVSLNAIKGIKDLDLSLKPSWDFARDMFMFSFYTRGMSFIDMAYLKRSNLQNGLLSYRRRKTDRQLHIKWEECMQEIVDKYPKYHHDYLLPIIRMTGNDRIQYQNALRLVNNKLKEISAMAELQTNLTMYVSRHSWASIARSHNIPLSVISAGMGHDSENTTQIYLDSLESSVIDNANSMILRGL